MKDALKKISSPRIGNIRGVGLMLGVELVKPNGLPDAEGAVALVKDALHHGILLLADSPHVNVLSFTPSFFLGDEEICFTARWLSDALNCI